MSQSRKITDGALLTAIYIALLLLVVFVPFIVTVGIFILPIPFIMYASRHGFKPTLLMFFVALLLSFIFATVISVPLTIMVGIGGIVIGSAIHRNLSAYETWAQGTLGFIVGIVLVVLIMQFTMDINIYNEMDTAIKDSVQMTKTMMDQMGVLSGPEAEKQIEVLEQQMYDFKDIIPSSIAIISIFFALFSQWLSYKMMNRIEGKKLAFPPFKELNLPTPIIWFYFFAIMMGLVELDETGAFYMVVINALTITSTLIAIQGFSFVFFYADHKKVHKAVPISILVITLIIPFLFLFIIRIIGIIDLGFSLKNRIARS